MAGAFAVRVHFRRKENSMTALLSWFAARVILVICLTIGMMFRAAKYEIGKSNLIVRNSTAGIKIKSGSSKGNSAINIHQEISYGHC